MKTYTKHNQPAKTVTVTDKVICDICKQEGTEYNSYTTNWETKDKEKVELVTITYEDGWDWNEDNGGNSEGDVYYFDICSCCFKNKLKPFLELLGAKCNKGLR